MKSPDRKPPAPVDLESGMLKTREAAQFLSVDHSTLRRWRMERTGPSYVIMGRRGYRYPKQALLAYAADRLRHPSMHAA